MRQMQNIHNVCGNLEVNLKDAELRAAENLQRESRNFSAIEVEAADRIRSLTEALAKSQSRLGETEGKLTAAMSTNEKLASQVNLERGCIILHALTTLPMGSVYST